MSLVDAAAAAGTTRTVNVSSPSGDLSRSVELPAEIFDVQVNVPLIHQVVVAQLAAARQGTHDTKTRGEVRGGGKKPYRQKGTGRARQGSTRAPQFAGGGTVHGPTPRSYAQRTPKKMKAAALRGALSDRARYGRVHVVSRPRRGGHPVDEAGCRPPRDGRVRPAPAARRRTARCRHAEERAQPRVGPPDRPGSAEHLRRAGQRRRHLHRGCAGRVPGRPAQGQGRERRGPRGGAGPARRRGDDAGEGAPVRAHEHRPHHFTKRRRRISERDPGQHAGRRSERLRRGDGGRGRGSDEQRPAGRGQVRERGRRRASDTEAAKE